MSDSVHREQRTRVSWQEQEGLFGALVRSCPDMITVLQTDGLISYQNPSCQNVLGYAPEAMIGQNVLEYVHADDVSTVRSALDELHQASAPAIRITCRFRHANGDWISVDSLGTNLLSDPNVRGIVMESRDVTAHRHAEEALRESESRYRTLLEQIPAIVYSTSFAEESTEFYVNPQIERMLGFSQQEWAAGPRLWLNRLHPQDKMRVLSELAHSHSTGEPFSSEYRLLTRDGRIVWFRDDALVVRDAEGHPVALHGVRMDITERKQAEEALHHNLQERLEAEEALRQRNRAIELLYRAGQVLGSTLDLESVLSTILEEVRHLLDVTASSIWLVDSETDELVCQEAVGVESDTVRGWRLPPGQGIVGWVVQNNETSIVPDAWTDERHLQGASQQTGFDPRSILTIPMNVKSGVVGVLQVLDTDVDRFSQTDLRLLESLAASAAGAIENARLYERAQQEITERMRAEDALREEQASLARRVAERTAELSMANAELARTARLKDEFLAAMSHELRTPLNAILGLSETLEEQVYGPLNERQLRCSLGIKESGRHLLDLINDILDVAKMEAGKLELRSGPVSVDSICQSSMALIKQMARQKQLRVSLDKDSTVTILQADGRRIKQILVNLLSNACKFTPEGGEIGLQVTGDVEAEVVHFTVWDTGIGISAENMERLFQPFVQLDSSLSRRYEGTGLGLALVRRLAELHGGGVSVESEGVPGKGSRFTVSLPWQGAELLDEAVRSPGSGMACPVPERSSTDLSGARSLILLADDNETNISTYQDYLEAKGYRVIVARNGTEAIARAQEERPYLILMDIQMPEMDGLEATKRIRADAVRAVANIPIVALTALAMPGDRERCLQAGANTYLSKPVSLKRLLSAIEAQQTTTNMDTRTESGIQPSWEG